MSGEDRLAPQSWMTRPETRAVVDALTADGTEIRFVGGCVRNALIGRPIRDIDIATPAAPTRVIEQIEAAGLMAVPTGIDHGTVTAVANGIPFEITTLRHDVETHGRHATVAFTEDWVADAERRDFTMNAVYASPDGTLFDPMNGVADARAGRVRFVGEPERRIREDVLRILRFYRFHAELGCGDLDTPGRRACRGLADLLPKLSGERMQAELARLLAAPGAAATIAAMAEDGIFAPLFGTPVGTRRFDRLRALEERHGVSTSWVRGLAALLYPDPDAARTAAERLKLSNHDGGRLARIAAELTTFRPLENDPVARRVWFYRRDADLYRDLVLLAAADRETAPDGLAGDLAAAAAWRKPDFPLAGPDVLALGVGEGPQVGRMLRAVEDWWIENDFKPDRATCLARLRGLIESR